MSIKKYLGLKIHVNGFLTSLFMLLASFPSSAQAPFEVLVGLAKPPYVLETPLSGFEIDMITAVLAGMGETAEFIFVPYGKSVEMLHKANMDAVMTTNSRVFQDTSKLSDVYITYENIAISLKSKQLTINNIAQLSSYSMAAFQNSEKVLGGEFKQAAKQSPLFLKVADQGRQTTLLVKDRVEVLIMDKNIFNYFVDQQGIDTEFDFHYLFPPNHYRMGFKDQANVVKFNKSLLRFRQSPAYKNLLNKYNLSL